MELLLLAAVAASVINPTTAIIFVGGVLQPYLQEFLLRNKVSAQLSLLITAVVSFIIAGLAIWLTGGLSGIILPQFALSDPSPFIGALIPYFTAVFTLSQLVFHGTESTPADPHVVANTAATVPLTP